MYWYINVFLYLWGEARGRVEPAKKSHRIRTGCPSTLSHVKCFMPHPLFHVPTPCSPSFPLQILSLSRMLSLLLAVRSQLCLDPVRLQRGPLRSCLPYHERAFQRLNEDSFFLSSKWICNQHLHHKQPYTHSYTHPCYRYARICTTLSLPLRRSFSSFSSHATLSLVRSRAHSHTPPCRARSLTPFNFLFFFSRSHRLPLVIYRYHWRYANARTYTYAHSRMRTHKLHSSKQTQKKKEENTKRTHTHTRAECTYMRMAIIIIIIYTHESRPLYFFCFQSSVRPVSLNRYYYRYPFSTEDDPSRSRTQLEKKQHFLFFDSITLYLYLIRFRLHCTSDSFIRLSLI